jgi:nucleotide-binding universal stress UspA family protein
MAVLSDSILDFESDYPVYETDLRGRPAKETLMRSFSKILLPVDFSERSTGAARYAQALALHFHAELILLHVLTPPNYEFGALEIAGSMLDALYRNRAEQASKELDAFMTAEPSGLKVRRIVLEGDPAKKIVDLAHDEGADIIAMPTHGCGPFRRFILGSNTAKVLHDADCPVWTGVHLEQAPALASIPFRSILCAVDLGPQSSKTIPSGSGGRRPAPRPGGSCSVSWMAWARKAISRLKLETRPR